MTKRTPSMYAFYERQIKKAYEDNNLDLAEHLISDAPADIKKALIRNDIIEGSVDSTRERTYRVTIKYLYEVYEHETVTCTEDEIEDYAEQLFEKVDPPGHMNNEYLTYIDYEYNEV